MGAKLRYLLFLDCTFEFIKMQVFMLNKKKLPLKLPYLSIFRLGFEKTIVIFEISSLEFAKMQSFIKNKEVWVWDQYCLIWVFFLLEFEKNYCHIWYRHLRICLNAKFHVKEKKNKLVTFRLEFKKPIVILEISTFKFIKNGVHIF